MAIGIADVGSVCVGVVEMFCVLCVLQHVCEVRRGPLERQRALPRVQDLRSHRLHEAGSQRTHRYEIYKRDRQSFCVCACICVCVSVQLCMRVSVCLPQKKDLVVIW